MELELLLSIERHFRHPWAVEWVEWMIYTSAHFALSEG